MNTISKDELKKDIDNNEAHVVEVLSEDDYNQEHIKDAIHIPLEKIATEARNRFNEDDKIVVYCTDKECTASPTAAKKLESSGFKNVFHYKGGKKEWKAAELPME